MPYVHVVPEISSSASSPSRSLEKDVWEYEGKMWVKVSSVGGAGAWLYWCTYLTFILPDIIFQGKTLVPSGFLLLFVGLSEGEWRVRLYVLRNLWPLSPLKFYDSAWHHAFGKAIREFHTLRLETEAFASRRTTGSLHKYMHRDAAKS